MRIEDTYRILWRYKLLIVTLTAGLVGLAWWLTSRERPVYQASALVRVQQRIDDPGQALVALATGEKLAQTYATIAKTRTIALRVEKDLDGQVPLRQIIGHISASPLQDLDLLSIRVRGDDPVTITKIANATPIALRAYIDETGTLRDRVTTAEEATIPTSPVTPSMKKNIALAIALGLLLNCGLALVLQMFRDPVGTSEEIERATRLPVLATIPRVRFARRRGNDRAARGQPEPSTSPQELPSG